MSFSKWDFSNIKYNDRDRVAAGNRYGIGEGAKVGKLRHSYLEQPVAKSKLKTPPSRIA